MKRLLVALLFVLAFSGTGRGQNSPGRWAILVSGLSGDPDLQNQYLGWIRDLYDTLTGSLQFPADRVYVLFDDPSKDPSRIRTRSTRENLERTCREIASRVQREDLVFVFIAGHGNYDAKTYKLNLPGPDPTAEELAAILYSIPAQRFVVVNTTTCSGGSVASLASKGKIVLSATKSGMEKNQTHMGKYFVEALKNGNADRDKNGRVSILEAFNYAAQKVEEYYTGEGLLRTEHPVLEDTGDGEAQMKPGPDNGEGLLARTTFLDPGVALRAEGQTSPEDQAIVTEMQSVEKQIETLKYMKSEMTEEEYEKKLEQLLLKLASLNAKLRKDK